MDEEEFRECLVCDGSEVYALRSPFHIIFMILNVIVPGAGTMLSACSCFHFRKTGEKSE